MTASLLATLAVIVVAFGIVGTLLLRRWTIDHNDGWEDLL